MPHDQQDHDGRRKEVHLFNFAEHRPMSPIRPGGPIAIPFWCRAVSILYMKGCPEALISRTLFQPFVYVATRLSESLSSEAAMFFVSLLAAVVICAHLWVGLAVPVHDK